MASATRQQLLDAAVELLVQEGRSGVTTGRLTGRAGVVQSAFYNHYASVEDCIQAALAEIRRRVAASASVIFEALQGPGYTTPDQVDGLLIRIFKEAAHDPTLFRVLVQRHHEPDVAEAVENVLDLMRAGTVQTILHPQARTNTLGLQETTAAAGMMVGAFLAGLEQVLDGADPVVVSRVCAQFLVAGVFSMADVEIEASPEPQGSD